MDSRSYQGEVHFEFGGQHLFTLKSEKFQTIRQAEMWVAGFYQSAGIRFAAPPIAYAAGSETLHIQIPFGHGFILSHEDGNEDIRRRELSLIDLAKISGQTLWFPPRQDEITEPTPEFPQLGRSPRP